MESIRREKIYVFIENFVKTHTINVDLHDRNENENYNYDFIKNAKKKDF